MENIRYFIPLGTIQNKLISVWKDHGKKLTFAEAVTALYREDIYTYEDSTVADYTAWNDKDPETLRRIHESRCVEVTDIISHPDMYTSLVPEDISFFKKDVWPMILLNYEAEHMHSSACFELIYIMKGQSVLITDSGRSLLQQNEFCIVSPDNHSCSIPVEDSIVLDILIKRSTFDSAFSSILSTDSILADFFNNYLYSSMQNYMILTVPVSTRISDVIRSIMIESYSDTAYSREICNLYAGILLAEVLREYTDDNSRHLLKRSSNVKMPLILAYIRNHYTELSLGHLAEEFGYDTDYMGKLIYKSTGMHFNDILNSYRIQHASDLLLYTDYSLDEISELSGFNSADHFNRTFKKIKGLTPGRFRKGYK